MLWPYRPLEEIVRELEEFVKYMGLIKFVC
jgi:hypothetical protein